MEIVLNNLPEELQPALTPVLERVIAQLQPKGLWLFGSWARGSQSARSDIDLLIEGFEGMPVLKAYDQALEAIGDCQLPLQPLVAAPSLLARHGDSPFWRSVKAEAKPLLEGSVFP
jgi:predicted nucleotidyltransferase